MLSSGSDPVLDVMILLMPGFSMLSTVSILEPLHIANRIAGRALCRWSLCSEGGLPVASSLGLELPVDVGLEPPCRNSIVLVCGGTDVLNAVSPAVLAWVRHCASHGATFGGLCTGAHVLAQAGVLRSHSVVIHWEHHDSFAEDYPGVKLEKATYWLGDQIWSTAGGTASIDLVLEHFIQAGYKDLAGAVAMQLMYSQIHELQKRATLGHAEQLNVLNPKLRKVIEAMEGAIEEPLPLADLAAVANVSGRQLERLFKKRF